MAGAVILTLRIIILFFLTERFLVEGLTAGARRADVDSPRQVSPRRFFRGSRRRPGRPADRNKVAAA